MIAHTNQQVVITNFVPPEEVTSVERRAQWNEEASAWLIPRLELAGNSLLRMRRPVSAAGLPRPEAEYARHRKGYGTNPRWVVTGGETDGGTEGRRDGGTEGRRVGGSEGRRDGGTKGRRRGLGGEHFPGGTVYIVSEVFAWRWWDERVGVRGF